MKPEPSDPSRLGDDDSNALGELLRSARQKGPSDEMVQRLSNRLRAAGVPMSPAPIVEESWRNTAYYKLGLVALAVVGGALFSWPTIREVYAPATHAAPTARLEPISDKNSAAAPQETWNGAATSVDELPAAVPSATPSSAPSTPSPVKATRERTNPQAPTELALVQRAQALLATDPQRALATTDEHARAYPKGEFTQERELSAVEALARMGRKEEALGRARALIQRYPRTPYAARLETAVGPLRNDGFSASPNELSEPRKD